MRQVVAAVTVLLLAVGSLSAATFEPVSDAQLVERAELVVKAHVAGSESRVRGDGSIVTDYRLIVADSLKGAAPRELVVTELGGMVDGRMMIIPGSARYDVGAEVVAFLKQRADGTWFTSHMGLGSFRIRNRLATRDRSGIDVDDEHAFAPRDAAAFVEFIRSGGRGASAIRSDARLPRIETNGNAADYVLQGDPPGSAPARPLRWPGCESNCIIGFFFNGSQPGVDHIAAMEAAAAVWTNDPNSFVNIGIGSSTATNGVAFDGENVILLNSNANDFGICQDALGCGIVWATSSTHNFDGSTFYNVEEADLIIRPTAAGQSFYTTLIAHEMGHGLALKHGPSGALMSASIPSSASLRSWDMEAMAEVYGNGVPCVPPTITGTSGGGSVNYGTTRQLSVTVSGSGPFTYNWFRGSSGDISNPVGSNSANFTTPAVTETVNYWVRVTSNCGGGADDSDTITVTATQCNSVAITKQPTGKQIASGGNATLTVEASGTSPLTYRWFEGSVNTDESKQVGNAATFTTPALTTSKSYWAKVTNACGTARSAVATITVGTTPPPCTPVTITSAPASGSVPLGSGVTFAVAATGTAPLAYQWYVGEMLDVSQPITGATGEAVALPAFNTPGTFKYWVRVTNTCGVANSNTITITVACGSIATPKISVPAIGHVSTPYEVQWSGVPSQVSSSELQEATDPQFTKNLKTYQVTGAMKQVIDPHTEITADTRFYYRVRSFNSCTGAATEYSRTASIVITRPQPADSKEFSLSVPHTATQPFRQDYLVPGFGANATNGDTFSIAIVDAPWLTVFPRNGALSAGGTTVQFTINPAALTIGTTSASVVVTRSQGASKGVAANAVTTISLPFSVSKVTPVTPEPRSATPPPGTLIIPAVAHADGIGTRFQSDVRIANTTDQEITYEISFTPSGTNGTESGKKTSMVIAARETKSLDDIVKAWYGAGLLNEPGVGTLEIRPPADTPVNGTVASSRTYAVTEKGTLGQFIPALGLDKFIGSFAQDSLSKISLQQIINTPAYRTNVGFVEGAGEHVEFTARLLDGDNRELATATRSLPPYGHEQMGMSALFGNVPLQDGRIEVLVTSASGKATAYASVIDNDTSDPLMIFPTQAERFSAQTFVVPGIAEVSSSFSNFHSDMRIYNASQSPVTINLNFYPLGNTNPQAATAPLTIGAGQVRALNDVLPSIFGVNSGAGSVTVNAPSNAPLVVTARTYSREADGGTYGQFIPGVTASDATGTGERGIELLQLEQSNLYRTNVGLIEVTGKPVMIEITAESPQNKTSAVTTFPMSGHEFRQGPMLADMGFSTVFNGRITIRVIGGEGRIAAYGSVIDSRTSDPTYVPAQ